MIEGLHAVIFSADPEADRAFLRDVLGLPHADAGDGWLIFGLPPSEMAVHPSDKNDLHLIYLLADDIEAFTADLASHGIECSPIQEEDWGRLTHITLPGGGKLGAYQPKHVRP
ncbi:MAG: VOC family protein [Anaerolineae bacterium]|jgi:catechol 2,3-dioxygenase-like lactoylglutathione lyase family enzyme